MLARRIPHIATNYSRCNFQGKSLWYTSNARRVANRTFLFVVEGAEIPKRMSHKEVTSKKQWMCELWAANPWRSSRSSHMNGFTSRFVQHSLMPIMSAHDYIINIHSIIPMLRIHAIVRMMNKFKIEEALK